MKEHTCKEYMGCACSMEGLEPDENCPVHGYPWPPRCECGRFVKRVYPEYETVEVDGILYLKGYEPKDLTNEK